MAFAGTFVICILTALTFFWLMIWAGVAIVPLLALNLSGAVWALAVGTWRWRALQKQAPVVAAGDGTLPQEKRPALLGLRAIEIVGLVVGVFMLIAAILALPGVFLCDIQIPASLSREDLRGAGKNSTRDRPTRNGRLPHEVICHMSRNVRCGTKVRAASSALGDASADWR
jgi:hypothetical protein